MKYLTRVVRGIGGAGVILGGGTLTAIMMLVVANVLVRFFGQVIAGTYELIEITIVVTIAFAVGYTALEQGHVTVAIVVSRFSKHVQTIFQTFTLVISVGYLGLMVWATLDLIHAKAPLGEKTELLGVPFQPFRYIWLLGLLFFCFVLLIDLFRALRQGVRK
jgi:TRAP-type C4-dicarboxylate transport system permease small subunit